MNEYGIILCNMDNDQVEIFKRLANRLDVLIRVTALSAVRDLPLNEKLALLSSIGFGPKEIANILGKDPNNVRVALFRARKVRKGEKNG